METCALSERSEELRILLAFMHPGAVPSIRDISMQVLGRLAVAADKYGVYTLVELCKAVMGLRAKEDPFFVLCHAVDYHYCDLYESVAPLTISKTLEEANKGILSPTTFRAWVLWRNEHQQVKRFILDYSFQSSCPLNCPGCAKIQNFRNALILAFDAEGIGLNGTAMYQKLSSITQPTRLSSWSKSSYYQPWCSQRAKYLMQKLKEFIDGRQLRISDFL
ncbi:hypothetical protein AX16_000897 [Volvariella volvacea WC 439]|nr:hypothetical protein AX16_000897 [Volvariella volvacea WC 439]